MTNHPSPFKEQGFHNIELEFHVLQSLIDLQNAYDTHHSRLSPSLFFYYENQIIYNAIVKLKTEKPMQELNMVVLSDYLQHINKLGEIVGEEYLIKLMGVTSLAKLDSLEMSINSLQEWKAKRIINEAAKNAVEQLRNGTYSADVANKLIETINKAQVGGGKIEVITPLNTAKNLLVEMTEFKKGELNPFINIGYEELSFKLQLVEKDLFILAGRPSMGKSALAMNIVTAIALNNPDKNALVFSLEMPADGLNKRVISAQHNVKFSVIRGAELATEQDYDNLIKATENHDFDRIKVIAKNEMKIQDIRVQCQEVKRIYKKDFSVIMIDYLGLIDGIDIDESSGMTKNDKIGKVTRQLKYMAIEYNCPVILLSQLNRKVEDRNNKRPMASDLRDSGNIEQDADIIAMIYRDEVYHKDTLDKDIAEINVIKNRNGSTGVVKLKFDGEYVRFLNNIPNRATPDKFYN